MQFRRGFLITSTILIIILIIPITWLLWKFVCKPVYRHFTDKQTPVEQAVNNKSRDTKKEVKYDGKAEKSDKPEKSDKKPGKGESPRRNKQRPNKKASDTGKNDQE